MKKSNIIILCLLAVCLMAAAAPRGVQKFNHIALYGSITGATRWRAHAHADGGANTADTLTCTGAVAGGYGHATWQGVTPGTQALSCSVGTDKILVYCLAVDTALFRTAGYNAFYIK